MEAIFKKSSCIGTCFFSFFVINLSTLNYLNYKINKYDSSKKY